MENFGADPDSGTLPPGTVSRQATERMLEVTGTAPAETAIGKQADIRRNAFLDISENAGKPRTKWTPSEVRRLATQDQWDYGQRHGHLDVGTTCAVGNLLLKGMSPSAVRKALGITAPTWNTWYAKGTGDGDSASTHTHTPTHTPSTDTHSTAQHTDTQVYGTAQSTDTQYEVQDTLPQAPYNVFAFIVDHSQALMELRAVQGWTGHFERDWKAAQAYLVARNPDEWNPVTKSTIDTTTRVDHTVTTRQDTEGLYEVAAILARAGALPKSVATAEVVTVDSVEVTEQDGEATKASGSGHGDQ